MMQILFLSFINGYPVSAGGIFFAKFSEKFIRLLRISEFPLDTMIVGNVADDSDHPETRLEKMNNMSMLESITRGREGKPPRLLVYGQEGTGKSTFAADAPSPVFVQTEDGLGEIDTAKFPLAKKFEEVTDALAVEHNFG